MQKKMIFQAVFIAFVFLTFFASAMAQYRYSGEEGKILFQVEGWWVTPTGMGFDVATVNENWYDDVLARGGGDVLGIESDSAFSGRYTLGWNFSEDFGSFNLSYWDYSKEPKFSRIGAPGSYIIGELIAHPYYAGQGYYDSVFEYDTGRADAVESMAKIETTFIDIDFSKNIPSDQNYSAQWSIGLRNFKYSHSFITTYLGDPLLRVVAPEPLEVLDIVTEEIESKGMGPKVGFSGRYSFTKNFSVYGGMNVSFIPGKIDSSYISHNDLERFDPDSEDEWGPFVFSLNRPKRDENFVMYDFDAGFRMAIAQKLNILFGYRFTKMENVIYRMRFIPDKDLSDLHANWDAAFSSQHSVNYAGLYFGVAYEF